MSEDRVRGWIKSGALKAINTSDYKCARPRFVVTSEMLDEFERTRAAAEPVAVKRPKRRREVKDYFPDEK